MIDLTIAQIAEIVGGFPGRHLAGGRRTAPRHRDRGIRLEGHRPGGLFLALPGARSDGHDHAPSAVRAGAVAVLAARPVGVPAILVDQATPVRKGMAGRSARARCRRFGRGGAGRAGQVGQGGSRRTGGGRADHRPGSPARRAKPPPRTWWLPSCNRWARWWPRPDPSTTSWATPGRSCRPPAAPTT